MDIRKTRKKDVVNIHAWLICEGTKNAIYSLSAMVERILKGYISKRSSGFARGSSIEMAKSSRGRDYNGWPVERDMESLDWQPMWASSIKDEVRMCDV